MMLDLCFFLIRQQTEVFREGVLWTEHWCPSNSSAEALTLDVAVCAYGDSEEVIKVNGGHNSGALL